MIGPHRRPVYRGVLAALLVTLLVAAGCSSGGGTEEGGGGSPTSVTNGSDHDPAGVVRVGYDLQPTAGGTFTFDPTKLLSSVHDAWLYMLYGRLMRPTIEGDVVPDQAESATIVDTGTIEIKVRAGQTFSDGTPFDAAAVKVGLDRNLAQGDPTVFTQPFYDLTEVTVTGPDTVQLAIKDGKAASWYDTFLGAFQTTITKAEVDESNPIGAGPFNLTSFRPEQSATYVKSDTYWDAESIKLGGIEILAVATDPATSGTSALQADQIDLTITDASQVPALTGDLDLFTQPDPNQTVQLMMCKRDGPLADARVRKAINLATDRESLSAAVYADTAEPMTEPWPEGHRFNDPSINDELSYDVAAAKQLLTEAGYPDGFDLDMYVVAGVALPEAAEVLEQQYAQIGVGINIIIPANYVSDFLTPQKAGMGLFPGGSPNRQKLNQWNGDATSNTCRYSDDELNSLVASLSTVSDSSDEAVELWHQIDNVIVEDALSGLILFRSRLAAYNSDNLGGLAVWPSGTVVVPDPRLTWIKADG